MPVNLRKFYLQKLTEAKQRENDEYKKSKGSTSPKPPAISPRK